MFFMDLFNNLSLVSWTIRGAFGRNKRRHVRDIISLHHPSLFLVYETHGPFVKAEHMWLSQGYKPIFIQEARGHSGGIWVLSNRDDIIFDLVYSTHQAITLSIRKQNVVWYCSAVYASPVFTSRCELWDSLRRLRGSISGPWTVIGDLNEIIHSSEVSGG